MGKEVLHVVFGAKAVRLLDENDLRKPEEFDAVVNAIFYDGQLLKVDNEKDERPLSTLLETAKGWDDYLVVDADIYEELFQEVKMMDIEEWTASEAFNWLQENDFIGEDEIFEDHMDNRGDMIDTIQENYFKVLEEEEDV
jgi:hypothetical protein